jgi:hypothetical protein
MGAFSFDSKIIDSTQKPWVMPDMVKFYEDFSSYSVGAFTYDFFEILWGTSSTNTISKVVGPIDKNILNISNISPSQRICFAYKHKEYINSELKIKAKTSVVGGESIRLFSRASGSTGDESAYYLKLGSDGEDISIKKYVNGSLTNLDTFNITSGINTSIPFFLKFRIFGDNLKGKVWSVETSEPNWQLSCYDSDLKYGKCGFGYWEDDIDYTIYDFEIK